MTINFVIKGRKRNEVTLTYNISEQVSVTLVVIGICILTIHTLF